MSTIKDDKWFMLTTIDNPYSPFTEYRRWYVEDQRLGHYTPELLSRFTHSVQEFNDDSEFYSMKSIVDLNLSGKHIMVVKEDYDPYLKEEVINSL